MLDPLPFEIKGSGITAVCDDPGLLIAFAGEGDAKMFRLRAQRFHKDGRAERIEMLVAELNGVRAYFKRDAQGQLEVVVTTLELKP